MWTTQLGLLCGESRAPTDSTPSISSSIRVHKLRRGEEKRGGRREERREERGEEIGEGGERKGERRGGRREGR